MVPGFFVFAPAARHLAPPGPQSLLFKGGTTAGFQPSAHPRKGRSLPVVWFAARELSANDAKIFPPDGTAAFGHHLPHHRARMLLRALPLHVEPAPGRIAQNPRAPAGLPLQMSGL